MNSILLTCLHNSLSLIDKHCVKNETGMFFSSIYSLLRNCLNTFCNDRVHWEVREHAMFRWTQKSTEKRHLESNVKQYVSTNIQGIINCTLWLAKDHVHDCHRRIPYSSLHFLLLIRFKALYRGRLSQMCHKKLSTLPTYFALFNNVSNIFVWVVLPCNCQVMWGLLSKLLHLIQLLCGNLIYQFWLYICPKLLFPGV